MAANEIHVNDIGVKFLITVQEDGSAKDISSMTTTDVIFLKPDGTTETVTGNFETDGTNGQLNYVSQSGVLDQSGSWQIQVHLANLTSQKRTDIGRFRVHDNL